MRKIFRLIRQRFKTMIDNRHRDRLMYFAEKHDDDYQNYLTIQLNRTLHKRQGALHARTKTFVNTLVQYHKPQPNDHVLCIGCRNIHEIRYFQKVGFQNVIGIDLFSEHKEIMVMDMHDMTFPDGQFTVVYSSHSLEHAIDPQKVVAEIMRVTKPKSVIAIEVPIQYEPFDSDLHDFGGTDQLLALFGDAPNEILYAAALDKGDERNVDVGTSIARVIFQIK